MEPAAANNTSGAGLFGSEGQPASPAQPQTPSPLFSESVYKDGKFSEGWTERFQDKYPSAAGKLAQAKDEEGFIKTVDWAIRTASGRELKGLPNDTWTEVEKADYREKFGVPDSAEKYKFKPDQLAEGVHWPDEANGITEWLHQKGVPAEVVEGLGGHFHDFLKGQTTHALQKMAERIDDLHGQSEEQFRKEWGRDYDNRLNALTNYVKSQFTEDERKDPIIKAALSHPKIVALLERDRSSMREGPLPNGQPMQAGSMSPRQQARELARTKEFQMGDRETVKRVNDLYALDAQQRQTARR